MSNLLSIVLCNSLKAFVLLSLFALAIFSIPSKLHPPPFRNVVDRVLLYFRETRFFIINVILPVSIQAFNTLKATLSTALPNREESAFEEEFKYLIVTSSLLSDMPSLSQKYASTAPTHPSPKQQSNPPIFLIPAVTVTSLFCITSFLKSLAPLTRSIVVTASTSVALYAFHHQKRRARIRQIYSTALHLLRQLVTQCGQNDAQFARLLDRLHRLDLISQGHTLAPAASAYISLSDPSRQSVEIRRLLAHELRTQNQKYTTFIDRMDALSHQENLLRFRNMYNVEKMPTHTSDFESLKVSIEKLENMATMIHWKRRECVIHLLALDVMTADHDSTRHDYEQQWDSAIRIMREMVNECQRYNELLNRQLEHELVPESDDDDDDAEHPDRRTQAHLVHRYTALEKQMQQIRGKMLLCRQDTASITSSRNTTGSNYAFDRISERFSSIEQDLSHLMMQWEETKNTFDSLKQEHYHETALPPSSSNNSMLPSPPSSPKKIKEHMRMATPGSHRVVVRKAATIAYFLENRRTQKQRNHEQLLESLNQKRSSMSFSSALN